MELPTVALPTNLPLCEKIARLGTRTLIQLDRTDFQSFYRNVRSEGLNEAGLKGMLTTILRMLEEVDEALTIEVLESEYAVAPKSYVDLRIQRPGYPTLLLELKYVGPGYIRTPAYFQDDIFSELYNRHATGITFRTNPQLDAFRDFCESSMPTYTPLGIPSKIGALGLYIGIPGAKRKGLSEEMTNMSVLEFANHAVVNQLEDYLALHRRRVPADIVEGAVIVGIADRIFIHKFTRREPESGADALANELAALTVAEEEDENKDEEKDAE